MTLMPYARAVAGIMTTLMHELIHRGAMHDLQSFCSTAGLATVTSVVWPN